MDQRRYSARDRRLGSTAAPAHLRRRVPLRLAADALPRTSPGGPPARAALRRPARDGPGGIQGASTSLAVDLEPTWIPSPGPCPPGGNGADPEASCGTTARKNVLRSQDEDVSTATTSRRHHDAERETVPPSPTLAAAAHLVVVTDHARRGSRQCWTAMTAPGSRSAKCSTTSGYAQSTRRLGAADAGEAESLVQDAPATDPRPQGHTTSDHQQRQLYCPGTPRLAGTLALAAGRHPKNPRRTTARTAPNSRYQARPPSQL